MVQPHIRRGQFAILFTDVQHSEIAAALAQDDHGPRGEYRRRRGGEGEQSCATREVTHARDELDDNDNDDGDDDAVW